MTLYHAELAAWGIENRVANLPRPGEDGDSDTKEEGGGMTTSTDCVKSASVGRRCSAVAVSLPPSDPSLSAVVAVDEDDAVGLLLLALRALLDPSRAVRSLAWNLACHVLSTYLAPDEIVEETKWASFKSVAERYAITSQEGSYIQCASLDSVLAEELRVLCV